MVDDIVLNHSFAGQNEDSDFIFGIEHTVIAQFFEVLQLLGDESKLRDWTNDNVVTLMRLLPLAFEVSFDVEVASLEEFPRDRLVVADLDGLEALVVLLVRVSDFILE